MPMSEPHVHRMQRIEYDPERPGYSRKLLGFACKDDCGMLLNPNGSPIEKFKRPGPNVYWMQETKTHKRLVKAVRLLRKVKKARKREERRAMGDE